MFKIIGADQKEYGPVSTAQIRQWVTDGRLNAATTAQRATGGDWQPLSAFEEFADMFQAAGTAPAAQAATGTPYTPGAAPIPTASREMALSAVKGPAIALIIVGALGVAYYLFNTVFVFAGGGAHRPIPANATPAVRNFIEGMHGPMAALFSLFFTVVNAFIVFGAVRMMKLKGHSLAIITCIVAMIPCFSAVCCVLGLPFGIWGVIVLNKPEVKSQFEN
jgi:hypothetical protein